MIKILGISLSLLCLLCPKAEAQEAFPFVAKVKVKSANIRAGQNTNFEIIGQVPQGAELVVVGESFDWRKIKLPADGNAYVNAGFIQDLADNIAEVRGNRLNVRAAPANNASVIGQLKKGDLVKVIERKEDWVRIEPMEGIFGWVLNELIEKTADPVPPLRLVQKPSKNIYAKKRQEAAVQAEEAAVVKISGKVEDLGNNMISNNVRYYIQSGNTIYALKGFGGILDGFLHHQVNIEGRLKPQIKADKPVLLVTKISFAL